MTGSGKCALSPKRQLPSSSHSLCQRCHDLASLSSHYSWFQVDSVNSIAGGAQGGRDLGPCKITRGKLLFDSTPVIRVFKRLGNGTLKGKWIWYWALVQPRTTCAFADINHMCFWLSQEARAERRNRRRQRPDEKPGLHFPLFLIHH